MSDDATATSILTPTWMQIGYPKNTSDPMKATTEKGGLREENNRTFLCDKVQPQKSIFNIGHIRHNVHSKELTEFYNKMAPLQDQPQRLIQWQENVAKQGYDKPLTTKVGCSL